MYDYQNLSIYLKITEFMMSIIVSSFHIKTEFSIPQIGYGTNLNLLILSTSFSAMIVPFAVRIQASIVKDFPFEPITELLFTVAGTMCYAAGGLVTIMEWRNKQSLDTVFFRTTFNEIFLAKGL
ncbi:uncharacterized protein LOC106673123 isoform X2 [Cimex lectularius]|uniref:Uncharacterized protein n=1 Tax=Cimex lectularius TaxID=79782 RepID=A0A8I6S8K6_CIMLE|nr:uncharacterized protein LOC106673123 isoform X2 [Cimex lectularius]